MPTLSVFQSVRSETGRVGIAAYGNVRGGGVIRRTHIDMSLGVGVIKTHREAERARDSFFNNYLAEIDANNRIGDLEMGVPVIKTLGRNSAYPDPGVQSEGQPDFGVP